MLEEDDSSEVAKIKGAKVVIRYCEGTHSPLYKMHPKGRVHVE